MFLKDILFISLYSEMYCFTKKF